MNLRDEAPYIFFGAIIGALAGSYFPPTHWAFYTIILLGIVIGGISMWLHDTRLLKGDTG